MFFYLLYWNGDWYRTLQNLLSWMDVMLCLPSQERYMPSFKHSEKLITLFTHADIPGGTSLLPWGKKLDDIERIFLPRVGSHCFSGGKSWIILREFFFPRVGSRIGRTIYS